MSAYATSFFLPLAPSSAARGNNIGTSCAADSHLSDHDEKPSTHACAEGTSTKSIGTSRVPDILISVQSASVDPVGFVRALTGTRRKRPLPPPRSHASSNNNNAGPELNIKPAPSSGIGSSASDSIQFELSISHGGRKYSATRPLHRLVRLRQDLLREIAERRPGIVVPKRPPHHDNCNCNCDDDDTALTSTASSHSFDSDHQSRRNHISSDACANPPPPVVMIPELPVAGSSDASDDRRPPATAPRRDHRGLPVPPTSTTTPNTSGLVSGSFTALHLALMRYGPAVEDWFRHILTDILPDPGSSPSLLAFLWEPAAAGSTSTATGKPGIAGGKRHGSTRSIGTLGSIDEKDDGGDGDEEEDEEVTGGGYY